MKKLQTALVLGSVLVLAACVTINVYFPAAAAEKAAEKFVGDVLAEPREDGFLFDPESAPVGIAALAATKLLDFLAFIAAGASSRIAALQRAEKSSRSKAASERCRRTKVRSCSTSFCSRSVAGRVSLKSCRALSGSSVRNATCNCVLIAASGVRNS